MRVIAIIATYNEEQFIRNCLEAWFARGAQVYLLDNDSTDATVSVAREYLGRGLIHVERLERDGAFDLARQLQRKEELAAELEGDWFIHADADEIRLPPSRFRTFPEAFAMVEAEECNAVNFMDYTFIPTLQAPNHEHSRYMETMRRYYPFLPRFPHRLNAWRNPGRRIDLRSTGGHQVQFPGVRMYPESFGMKHYLFLSVEHAIRKYVERRFTAESVKQGWHTWRLDLNPQLIRLPSESRLRSYISDDRLDGSNPWKKHYLDLLVSEAPGSQQRSDARDGSITERPGWLRRHLRG